MNFGLNFRQNLGNSRLDCGYQAAAAADKAGRQTEGALLYLAAADSIARVAADPKESKKKKHGLAKKMPVSRWTELFFFGFQQKFRTKAVGFGCLTCEKQDTRFLP